MKQEYHGIRKPVYDKRIDIIKSIPNFWVIALIYFPGLSKLLNAVDKEIIKHLTSFEVKHSNDTSSVTFNFAPNSYFEDAKIIRYLTFNDVGGSVTGTSSVKWKEGMGCPMEFLTKQTAFWACPRTPNNFITVTRLLKQS